MYESRVISTDYLESSFDILKSTEGQLQDNSILEIHYRISATLVLSKMYEEDTRLQ